MVKHYLPKSLEETLELLDQNELKIIAGGTDLMVQRKRWANTKPNFESTINIVNVKELDYIKAKHNAIAIGSTTHLSEILKSDLTPDLLKKAISEVASPAIRNMATIAGNIVNASPAGDTLPILYTLDAKIKIIDLHDEIILPIESVILGPRKTILKNNQIIKEIIIPNSTFTKTSFKKVGGRKADAISKLNFTAAINVEENIVKDIRFTFGAVGPTMIRIKEIEQSLINQPVLEIKNKVPSIVFAYTDYIKPIDDQRSNKEYRKQVSLNLLEDFLNNL